MKKISVIFVAFTSIICLSGCGGNTAGDAAESETIYETSFPAGNTEAAYEEEATSEAAEAEISTPAESETEKEDSEVEDEQKETQIEQTEQTTNKPTSAEKPQEQPVAQSKTEKAAQAQTTESTETKPTETAASKTNPALVQKQTAAFDVSPYVEYAKSYAESIGLALDSTATDCWDNPITANAARSGIETDIQSRLNRYKNTEGFTAVWIWTEKVADTEYEIYIGYY